MLPEPECSRKHCEISYRDGEWVITDFESRNGTFVNEQQIRGSVALHANDTIRIALVKIQFTIVNSGDTASSMAAYSDDSGIRPPVTLPGPSDSAYWSPSTRSAMGPLLGESPATQELREQITRTAALTAPVLIEGPSGVGKGVVAAHIHSASGRPISNFVHWDCNGISSGSSLGESSKITAMIVPPPDGTMFVDEVGVLSTGDQAYLLSVLLQIESRADEPNVRNTRVIASSSINLEEAVAAGNFRQDLYFRLCVLKLRVPPLHERKEDILPLAEFFRSQYARRLGRVIEKFTSTAIAALESHSWPGNVRELENTIYRAVALCSTSAIDAQDLHLTVKATGDRAVVLSPPYQGQSLEDIELAHILATLNASDWNKTRSAQILGIERSTLDRKLKRYGLNRPPSRGQSPDVSST